MLAWSIYISFLGAAALMLRPKASAGAARMIALIASLASLVIVVIGTVRFTPGALLTVAQVPWIPSLGIEYHLAADGISLVLLLLTGIVAVAGVLFSWNVEKRPAEFFALYLTLIGACYGVFLSFDLFLFFVFYELAIIPKYFLIAIWGSTRREYAAMKLALYSFAGSAMVLIGIVATFVETGARTMDMVELARFPFPLHFEMWVFPLIFIGFAILAGMWPLHTWAPTGHAAAPTAASMLLAGVIMKLGAYGCLRVAMMLFPLGMGQWSFHVLGLGSWRNLFAVLGLIGIVYGATVALVQKDFKFVIGYSSVSHMGFVLLGLMTLTQIGLSGAVLQMFSHGMIAGLLFAVVGRMVYDRTHTRFLNELAPMRLAHAIPFAAFTFVVAAMASIGMPGFSGFIAELEILVGTWRAWPVLAVLAGVGILIGIAFTWRALDKAFFGGSAKSGEAVPVSVSHSEPLPPVGGSEKSTVAATPLPPITVPERIAAFILMASTVVVGVYPRLLLDLILPALNSPLFDGLRKGSVAMIPATAFNLLRYALPEVVVAFAGLAALTVDLAFVQGRRVSMRWAASGIVACAGCVAAILLILLRPENAALADGMLVISPLTQMVQAVLAAFTVLVVLLSINSEFTAHIGEYLGIILFATAGMMVLVSTQNLLVIFASLELLSLSLYILTAFDKRSRQSSEAALKYFLFGGMAASFFLFGISLLYGLSGSIELPEVAASVTSHPVTPLLAVAIVMIVTGFGFKVAAAPFHLWAPDTYQGAPTPSAGLVASSSKIAGFFVFAIVMALGLSAEGNGLHGSATEWVPLVVIVAALSMVLGNLAALAQSSFRRLLAYSAVGHAGYMLLGILANDAHGLRSLVYYVITYALATLGAFGVLVALEREGVDSIAGFAGLFRRAPYLSFCLLIFLLSLAGIPPLAGFFGKFYIFSAAYFAQPGLLWLVCLAIAMSVVSLYYYLRVLKQVYVRDWDAPEQPIATPLVARIVVGFIALLVVVLGCYPDLLLDWIGSALRSIPH